MEIIQVSDEWKSLRKKNSIRKNRLAFVSETNQKSSDGHRISLYRCTCGNEKMLPKRLVNSGVTKSCGCLAREYARESHLKHGYRYKPEYRCWMGMKARCTPGSKDFHKYGAKGISVFEEWKHSFQLFLDHIGPRPKGMNSVDRIDGSKGYEPGNVRWANPYIQSRNRKDVKLLKTEKYGTLYVSDYAKILGISAGAVYMRLKRGKLEGLNV